MHQIIYLADLTCRMAQKGIPHIVRLHPGPVVRNPDQRNSAVLDFHLHSGCPGIDRILHQLLDYGGRAFYHLSGGDLIDCNLI